VPLGVSVGGPPIDGGGAGAGAGSGATAGGGAAGAGAGCGAGAAFGATLRAVGRFLGFVAFLAVRLEAFLATTFFLVARFVDFFRTRFFALLFAFALLLGLADFLFAFLAMWTAPLLRWSTIPTVAGAPKTCETHCKGARGRTNFLWPARWLRSVAC